MFNFIILSLLLINTNRCLCKSANGSTSDMIDNGGECWFDAYCASRNCENLICKQGKLKKGNWCNDNRQCLSNNCAKNICGLID
jgi:hypothetical protein